MAQELNLDPVTAAVNGGDDYRLLYIVPLEFHETLRRDFQDWDIIATSPTQTWAKSWSLPKELRSASMPKAMNNKKIMKNTKYTHVDCFAGPGGFCTGLTASGFNTKVAVEYIRSCCDTYSHNHPDVHMICNDIRKVQRYIAVHT